MLLFQPLFKIKLLFSPLEANRKACCCKSRLGSETCKDELTAPSGDQSSYRTQLISHQSSAAVHGGKLRSRQEASTEQLQKIVSSGARCTGTDAHEILANCCEINEEWTVHEAAHEDQTVMEAQKLLVTSSPKINWKLF
jgi:hypothetical protein